MNHSPLLNVARALAECLVSHPDLLRLEIAESTRQVFITINGHRDDISKLMGRGCQNVKAIQGVIQLLTEREAKDARVNIAEGWTGEKGAPRPPSKELFENAMIRRLDMVCKAFANNVRIQKVATSTHVTLTALCDPLPSRDLEPCLQMVFKAFGGANRRFVTIEVVGMNNESLAA